MRLHPQAPQGCAAACVRPCVHTEGTHPPRAAAPLGSSSCPPASCQQARHSRTGLSGCFFPPWRGLGREMWPRCNANRQGLCTTSSWGWEPARARGTGTVAVLAAGDAETTPWGILGPPSLLPPLQRGLSAWPGPAPCPAAARGSLMSLQQTTASQPSAPRAPAWAPWRNDDTSRLARALRNAERGRTAPGEQSPAPPGELGGGEGARGPPLPSARRWERGLNLLAVGLCWYQCRGDAGVPAASPRTAFPR